MAINYSELINDAELLDFSQNLSVFRSNYMGSTLFPDKKAQYIKAEYARIAANGNLPGIAYVHALDTEANIATRVPFEVMETEPFLIKRKINLSEALRKASGGMEMDGAREYAFDDVARMAESVVTRAEASKMEVIATGKLAISENGYTGTVDYGVPEDNYFTLTLDEDTDVIGALTDMYEAVEAGGIAPNRIVTTRAIFNAIRANEGIQTAIFGTAGVGALPTREQINSLLSSQFDGMTLDINEGRYGVESVNASTGAATRTAARFFPAGKLAMFAVGNNGAVGTGLWGVTPEEESQGGAFDERRQQQYVTVTQWDTPDPVAHWTKASGMFIPVLTNPTALAVNTVTISEG